MNLTSNGSAGASNGAALGIAHVPVQPWEQPYDPQTGLNHGTIFPSLDLPFFAAGGEQ